MKIKRNIILLTFIVGNLALGKEKYPGLELIKTETIGYTKILENHDKSRIYLKNGAIWVVKDEGRENKKLDLTLPDTMEIKNEKLNGGVSIGIESNYPYVVTHYVIEIYRGDKKNRFSIWKILKWKYNNRLGE
ncbi:MAG: hypothetical protein MJH09_05815 [Cetobacterium sp.]|nr:hypothetical protein [Cetobacterium sp.]